MNVWFYKISLPCPKMVIGNSEGGRCVKVNIKSGYNEYNDLIVQIKSNHEKHKTN